MPKPTVPQFFLKFLCESIFWHLQTMLKNIYTKNLRNDWIIDCFGVNVRRNLGFFCLTNSCLLLSERTRWMMNMMHSKRQLRVSMWHTVSRQCCHIIKNAMTFQLRVQTVPIIYNSIFESIILYGSLFNTVGYYLWFTIFNYISLFILSLIFELCFLLLSFFRLYSYIISHTRNDTIFI